MDPFQIIALVSVLVSGTVGVMAVVASSRNSDRARKHDAMLSKQARQQARLESVYLDALSLAADACHWEVHATKHTDPVTHKPAGRLQPMPSPSFEPEARQRFRDIQARLSVYGSAEANALYNEWWDAHEELDRVRKYNKWYPPDEVKANAERYSAIGALLRRELGG